MSDNLPANVPVRKKKEISLQGDVVRIPANPPVPPVKVVQGPPSLLGTVLIRRQLAQFIRFASRLSTKSATPALRCCLFGLDSVVVTDLDVALRGSLPGAERSPHPCVVPTARAHVSCGFERLMARCAAMQAR
jgi:hypothetical protein